MISPSKQSGLLRLDPVSSNLRL